MDAPYRKIQMAKLMNSRLVNLVLKHLTKIRSEVNPPSQLSWIIPDCREAQSGQSIFLFSQSIAPFEVLSTGGASCLRISENTDKY